MTEPSRAVFLSYASQDAEAAKRICEALRAAGIEVWFDQSELRGGEAWDRKIRKEIHDCALFIPVISVNAHARVEGYFRLEWKLAVDRSHLMAPDQTFLLPVVIDSTPQTDERIPDRFRELQWSRLADGHVPPAFIDRVQRLLSPVEPDAPTTMRPARVPAPTGSLRAHASVHAPWSNRFLVAIAVLVLGALGYLVVDKFWASKKPSAPRTSPAAQTDVAPTAFHPPPHSIAVLPFVNMSGDKDQEYFSDGLSEELLNSLARINELQVAARTSSFYFKSKEVDLSTIAHKLNVASVLEGSVRRSGHTVRVTAQLNDAITGYHLWSQTYDRDLRDVLEMQTEIAGAVANALKITLLSNLAMKVELGGTHNPAAFDAYIRATKAHFLADTAKEEQAAADGFTQALRLDPEYALAYAGRSLALSSLVVESATTQSKIRASLDLALSDARKSIGLAADLPEGHMALASAYESSLDFKRADEEYQRALSLAPTSARVLRNYGVFTVLMGKSEPGLAMVRRAVALDPLSSVSHNYLGQVLRALRRYDEAVIAYTQSLAIQEQADSRTELGLTQYLLGDAQAARASCESVTGEYDYIQQCLAIAYYKLGRHADAEASLTRLKALWGDSGPTVYATVYAQWGEKPKAMEWLETAARLRNPGLETLKTHPLLDPLRYESRFQTIERALKFPE